MHQVQLAIVAIIACWVRLLQWLAAGQDITVGEAQSAIRPLAEAAAAEEVILRRQAVLLLLDKGLLAAIA